MIIGSRCIDKFPDINKAGINIKSEINKAKKQIELLSLIIDMKM